MNRVRPPPGLALRRDLDRGTVAELARVLIRRFDNGHTAAPAPGPLPEPQEFQVELFLGGRLLSSELLERSIATARYGYREFFKLITSEAAASFRMGVPLL